MHGQAFHETHPLLSPVRLWWGSDKLDRPGRPRNLFRSFTDSPSPGDMFRAGGERGLISTQGVVERAHLHRLMAQLSNRIDREGAETRENRRIPSGYTYLLQFIAHDMADSIVSFDIDGDMLSPGARNARAVPLFLDTLYGAGPDESPEAYELTKEVVNELGQVPRIRLRVGPRGAGAPPTGTQCPFHDIARGTPNSHDTGIAGGGWLTEPMLADPRNDAHSIVSQMTVLFQVVHNHIVDLLTEATSALDPPDVPNLDTRRARGELAFRRFRCARLVLTLIYRNIIEKDVLEKILDKRIYDRYLTDPCLPYDSGDSIPVEFTFGAFRFAHAIVRDSYLINSLSPPDGLDTKDALLRTSHRKPGERHFLPLRREWLVDWAYFFGPSSSPTVNFSKLIGPRYPRVLQTSGEFSQSAIDASGLVHRDLLSACYAGTLSVPALCRQLQNLRFEMVEEFDAWKPRLKAWLPKDHYFPDTADTERIINDPPLPFFVLFEAAYCGGPAQGQHLGPIGSIIVAETILGAMKRHPVGVESPGSTLPERIRRCVELFFGEDTVRSRVLSALSDLNDIATMPDLLASMERQQLFATA